MPLPTMPLPGVNLTVQSGVTTGNGTIIAPSPGTKNHTVTVRGSAGVASGAIQIETSSEYDYAGDWAPLGSPITVVADDDEVYTFQGVYKFLRARVSTTIGSGTVSVTYLGA